MKIIDYNDDSFEAEVLYYRVEYDLAILRFQSSKEYEIIKLSENDASINDNIIAVGNPKNKRNAISFGNTISYKAVQLRDSELVTNVDFEVLAHSANINKGSSGGALLNEDLELVAINYAVYRLLGFKEGYAIPLSRILEFLSFYT
jgi:serine protease Do